MRRLILEEIMSGVPFMMTTAMRAALRHRGLTDSDISAMTPEDAHRILLTPDEDAIRSFLETFVALAIKSLGGRPAPGLLQMCRKHPNDSDVVPARYHLGALDLVDRMTHDALVDSEAGHNVYIEGRFVKPGLAGRRRGKLKDTACVFALVADSDADKKMAWIPPAGVRPTLTVETSPNNHQYWFFFDTVLPPVRARRLGEGLRLATGSDHDTGTVTQPYRIPGTVNYPDKVKIANGRFVTPTLFLGAVA
jgi:hypothetical protein